MDNIRLVLGVTLVFILLSIYQAWQVDYAPRPVAEVAPSSTGGVNPAHSADTPIVKTTEFPSAVKAEANNIPDVPTTQRLLSTQGRVVVETDVLKLEIDKVGGDIRRVYLRNYSNTPKDRNDFVRLMDDELPNVFVAQSGLLPADTAPSHQAVYSVEQNSYKLADGSKQLEVKLSWQNPQGVKVHKIYKFERGSYLIELQHQLENGSAATWEGSFYTQLQRTQIAEAGQSRFVYTYMGGAISSPAQRFEKITFDQIQDGSFEKENRAAWAGGWAGMSQHYFLAAWIPEQADVYKYYTKMLPDGQRYVLGMYGNAQKVAAGQKHSFSTKLYVGPKLQDSLGTLARGLDLTVDYGWFWFIAQPLFWLVQQIFNIVGNWGWAIILLTVMIKGAFFHLSAASYKSMANMRRLQPRLVALKEKYGDDRMQLNQAMMDMYKKEKINPLGGCLPILVQIPVFIALYWVLLESVEMRQASFIFWLNDLSSPDPYFVLPLIMGATMLLQHHLNPAPIDPVQQKVMMMLPLIFTVFFAFFPSGLVLYWVVNNSLSIAQQWVITKKIVKDF